MRTGTSKYSEPPVGAVFGRLTVIGSAPSPGDVTRPKWRFRCACGAETVKTAAYVVLGMTKSCGCLRDELAVAVPLHGMSQTPAYRAWIAMKYHHEDDVCDRWMKFENFLADVGHRPSDRHTFVRIDEKRDYAPDNCAWQTEAARKLGRRARRRARRYDQ